MRLRLTGLIIFALALAACSPPTAAPATATPLPTLAVAATPMPAAAGPSATPPELEQAAAPTHTAAAADAGATPTELGQAPEATLNDAQAAVDSLVGDPVLRTYRVMVSMQVNATFLADTAQATAAGVMEGDDIPVAALVYGTLTQSVDDDVAGVTPPAELAEAWAAAQAAHAGVKQVAGRWLLGELSAAEMAGALAPLQADLEAALVLADAAVAKAYHVQAASLTGYRARLTLALERLFE